MGIKPKIMFDNETSQYFTPFHDIFFMFSSNFENVPKKKGFLHGYERYPYKNHRQKNDEIA